LDHLGQRFRIYLTNSLEEHHPDTGTLFANWLSTEANEPGQQKQDKGAAEIKNNPYTFLSLGFKLALENLTKSNTPGPGNTQRKRYAHQCKRS